MAWRIIFKTTADVTNISAALDPSAVRTLCETEDQEDSVGNENDADETDSDVKDRLIFPRDTT